jgi:hypothetical protein
MPEISQTKLDEMNRQIAKLDALESGGVDNWEWYGESLREWFAENELDEAIDTALEGINDVLTEADVDYPAGHDAGHSITFDDAAMKKVLATLIAEAVDIEKSKAAQ